MADNVDQSQVPERLNLPKIRADNLAEIDHVVITSLTGIRLVIYELFFLSFYSIGFD
jgi:hypothetical protein